MSTKNQPAHNDIRAAKVQSNKPGWSPCRNALPSKHFARDARAPSNLLPRIVYVPTNVAYPNRKLWVHIHPVITWKGGDPRSTKNICGFTFHHQQIEGTNKNTDFTRLALTMPHFLNIMTWDDGPENNKSTRFVSTRKRMGLEDLPD